ncbi:MAG: hypothetical protein FRX48_09818 [Lasallia pustulata]|uniref:Uncharacterized protein n=1 Tax=Lasallia pustulata TaxID=136370 RepID=A0A5M8PCA7_9LECA|nr:MAG: hypothetical protein FRX48_09818 [Lasallia pustulata]
MAKYQPTHIDAKDVIAFAAIKMKEFYNSRHKPVFFKVGDLQQFVGPFRILERITWSYQTS